MNLPNPLTTVFDTIWNLLEADDSFNALFPVGNRIKYNAPANRDPQKTNITTADMMEVTLGLDGYSVNLMETSSTSKIVGRYSLWSTTGDYRINEFANQVNWIVLCNLIKWKETFGALEWLNGWRYVKRVAVIDQLTGLTDTKRERTIAGWSVLWRIEIEMHFRTVDLVPAVAP